MLRLASVARDQIQPIGNHDIFFCMLMLVSLANGLLKGFQSQAMLKGASYLLGRDSVGEKLLFKVPSCYEWAGNQGTRTDSQFLE